MYVCQKKKMVFIHNPKTAGVSLLRMLGFNYELNLEFSHINALDAKRRVFQDEWPNFFTFSFVRNPWDRVVSLYCYQRSTTYRDLVGINDTHEIALIYDFPEWLRLNDSRKSVRSNWFGHPQVYWTKDVTKVYEFENLEQSAEEICARFGLDRKLSRRNTSERSEEYRDYYPTQREIDIVERIDKHIILQMGYEF